jgi:predicted TIM-barrel fold metal-dependent hydrolase
MHAVFPRRGFSARCLCCGPADIGRRSFIAGGIAAVSAAATGVLRAIPAAAQVDPRRIDVHHHLAPPRWIADVVVGRSTGQRPLANWSPAKAIEDMDKGGVATAVTSISEPGVWFGDNETARKLARACNEYAAKLASDHPGRFGMFAALPMPDIDGSLREATYALDTLKADGVCLMTSYQSKYLGDPAFRPLLEELNRRKAVVYTHPVRADCCRNLVAEVAVPTVELPFDTTRTILSVVFSGTAVRFPDIRYIWSHAGGALPMLMNRIERYAAGRKDFTDRYPQGVRHELQKFYYDTASGSYPSVLAPLLQLVKATQVVFGTDFPFGSSAATAKGLADYGLGEADLRAIGRDNAARLFPRL